MVNSVMTYVDFGGRFPGNSYSDNHPTSGPRFFGNWLAAPEWTAYPFPHGRGECHIRIDDGPLLAEWDTLNDATFPLLKEGHAAMNSLTAAVKKFTTLKSLMDNWPELSSFAAKYAKNKTTVTNVTLNVEELNHVLNLPPEAEVAR